MKSSMVITDTVKFEEIINSIESSYSKLKDVFSSEDSNKEIINGTDVWSSAAQQSLYNKYELLSDSFKQIDYSLNIYIKFMKKSLEDYKLVDKEISNNIDIIANELDVNS